MTKLENPRGAPRRNPESQSSELSRSGYRQVGIGVGALMAVVLSLAGFDHWTMGRPSTRHEVSEQVEKLEPACRPILQARFKQKLVIEGRPLTRREVHRLAEGIEDCAGIDQQVAGLNGD